MLCFVRGYQLIVVIVIFWIKTKDKKNQKLWSIINQVSYVTYITVIWLPKQNKEIRYSLLFRNIKCKICFFSYMRFIKMCLIRCVLLLVVDLIMLCNDKGFFLFIKYFYIFSRASHWLKDHNENKTIRLFCVILAILFYLPQILLLTSTLFVYCFF